MPNDIELSSSKDKTGPLGAWIRAANDVTEILGSARSLSEAEFSKLFREEKDVRELIKLKTIYELLESISDRCEDVANLIEGVVLENS